MRVLVTYHHTLMKLMKTILAIHHWKKLIANHTTQETKGKVFGLLHLEHILRFCKTFKKIRKRLAFHLTFKTAGFHSFV